MIRGMKRQPGRLFVMFLVALGVLAAVSVGIAFFFGGSSSGQSQSSNAAVQVQRWIRQEHLPQAAIQGAKLFAISGCTTCHTYAGSGRMNLNAPDLTTIGSRHLGLAFEIARLKCPSCATPGSPMPDYAALGDTRLRRLAVFLEDSKGIR